MPEIPHLYLTCQTAFVYRCFERFSEISAKYDEILQISGLR